MSLSKKQQRIIVAHQQGYRVDFESGELYGPSGRKLNPYPSSKNKKMGYLQFSVSIRGHDHLLMEGRRSRGDKRVNVMVHQFVAYCVWGLESFESQVIRHLDDDKRNNHPRNLALGTFKDNSQDHIRNDLKRRGLWTDELEKIWQQPSSVTI